MKITWLKDIEKKYNLKCEGLNAKLHFKKEGDIAVVPNEFKSFISRKLSDAINTGVCTIEDSTENKDPKDPIEYLVEDIKKEEVIEEPEFGDDKIIEEDEEELL